MALLVDPESAQPLLDSQTLKMYNVQFKTHRPHTGTQVRPERFEEVLKQGEKITSEEAEKLWEYHHDSSTRQCSHIFWNGRCMNSIVGEDCDVS